MEAVDSVEDIRGRLSLEANISTERDMGGDIPKEMVIRGIFFQGDRGSWGVFYWARPGLILFRCHNSLGSIIMPICQLGLQSHREAK